MHFVFDLDDTLLDRNKALHPATRSALLDRICQGDEVVIATSRPLRSVRRFLDADFLGHVHLITLNGVIVKVRGEPARVLATLDCPLNPIIAKLMEIPRVRFSLELVGENFASNVAYGDEELLQMHAATPDMLISIAHVEHARVSKIAVDGGGENLMHLAQWVTDQGLKVIPALDGAFLNIVHPCIDKSAALATLYAQNRVQFSDIVAFGDDIPDIGMLGQAGTAVAMANAVDEVKAVADLIIGDCDEHPIAEFIRSRFN